jgi:hypothetical protein
MQKVPVFFSRMACVATRGVAMPAALLVLLLLGCDAGDDAPASALSPGPSWQLRSVVVVLRHGVRAPIDSALISRLTLGRPIAWPVPDGAITEHGKRLLEELGRYDAAWLKAEGVWPTGTCPRNVEIAVYANTERRALESARALSQGLAPLCDIPVLSRPITLGVDPLFRPTGLCPIAQDAACDSLQQALGMPTLGDGILAFRQRHHFALTALSGLSRPGSADASRRDVADAATRAPRKRGSQKWWEDHFRNEKHLASTILFEHANGYPAADLAWGHRLSDITREQLTLFLDDYHLFATGTPYLAQRLGTYLTRSILVAAQVQKRDDDATFGTPSLLRNRALFLVGHETSISPLVTLLQADWHHPKQMSRSPAGGHLVFARWRDLRSSRDYMRVEVIVQTDAQLRTLTPLSLDQPPIHYPVALPACPDLGPNGMCEMNSFVKWLNGRLAPDCPEYAPFDTFVRAASG